MSKAVTYYRVSTDKQGIRGLGIDAQRAAVESMCAQKGLVIAAEFTEVESGKKNDRPELSKARSTARAMGATLIVAKMDRLSRDVDMIRSIVNSKESVLFCDFPQIPEGPAGLAMLTMMAVFAEFECGMISKRTKDAMAAAKARGQKFGNTEALQRYHREKKASGEKHNTSSATEAAIQKAQARIDDVSGEIQALRMSGVTSLRAIAESLNARGITASQGGKWHRTSVARVLRALPSVPMQH